MPNSNYKYNVIQKHFRRIKKMSDLFEKLPYNKKLLLL